MWMKCIGTGDVARALECVRVGVEESVNVRRERRRSPEPSPVCSGRITSVVEIQLQPSR